MEELKFISKDKKNPETGTLEALMPEDLVCDENGNVLAIIKIDPQNRQIYSVKTPPYENKNQTAENNNEEICIISDDRSINNERKFTRKESREKNLRYLVVSIILMYDREMLFQKRSKNKKIDPGKLSVSAHGVAKKLYSSKGTPWKNVENIALLNSALEINEELRHGENTQPFTIRIWHQGKSLLDKYRKKEKINDPNTIFLLPEVFDNENNYPVNRSSNKSDKNKRARFLSMGYIFSKDKPSLSVDPHEVDEVIWKNSREIESELDGKTLNIDSKELIENLIESVRRKKILQSIFPFK